MRTCEEGAVFDCIMLFEEVYTNQNLFGENYFCVWNTRKEIKLSLGKNADFTDGLTLSLRQNAENILSILSEDKTSMLAEGSIVGNYRGGGESSRKGLKYTAKFENTILKNVQFTSIF